MVTLVFFFIHVKASLKPQLLTSFLLLIVMDSFCQQPNYTAKDTVRVLQLLSDIKKIKDNRNSVSQLADEALEISKILKYEKGIALSSAKKVSSYIVKGDFTNAVRYSLAATRGFEKLNMTEEALDQQLYLSTIYKNMGAERGTVDYLLKGLNLARDSEIKARKLNFKAVEINALNNEGIILRDLRYIQNKPELMDTALVKYQLAIKMQEKMADDDQLMQKLYNNISQVYIEHLKDYDKAMEVLNKSVAINKRINNKYNLSYNYANFSNLFFEKKAYEKAKAYAIGMLTIGNELKMPHRVMNAYGHLRKINERMNRYDSAYYYLQKRVELNDSLTNVTKTEQIANFQVKYETVKKELKINTLNKDNELKSRQTFWVSIIGIILLLGLGLSIWNYANLQKKKKVIELQNQLIQNALTEKETLLREIHHRVKNNLQIISSLLNIQSDNVDDPTVLSSIKEGQSRVQAMSLIHQNLYQSEQLSNINIENYLKELVVYLSEMFATSSKEIEVEVQAHNIEFDIDTAIPLGLIVNELVSNAYKYAFEEQEKGKISIEIKALNNQDYELDVKDNGKGLPPDFNPNKGKSLGLRLVKILSKQLRGKFKSSSTNGANFVVTFKDLRAFQNQ